MTKEEKEKAIDALKISTPVMAMTQEEFNDYIQTLNKVMDWLEQEPKTGHWIKIVVNGQHKIKCDKCDYIEPEYATYIRNYCPNCGVKMESEGEEGL